LNAEELEQNRRRRLILRVGAGSAEAAQQVLFTAGLTADLLTDGSLAIAHCDAVSQPQKINRMLVMAGYLPTHVLVEEEDLEQYFLRLVGMEGGDYAG
jgi:ABC-2 type transport system ATP-binding protein